MVNHRAKLDYKSPPNFSVETITWGFASLQIQMPFKAGID